jgi:two-component system sensor histidine kinase KdpD
MSFTALVRHWLTWVFAIAAVTVVLLLFRRDLEKTHIALAYLLVVLAGSASAGHRVGLALAGTSFLLFDWCFIPPYGTFAVANPLDWFVLAAFLVVSVVAAQMLYRVQVEAQAARQRSVEVDRVASLGAETLNVAHAADALAAISEVLRSTLGLSACRIHTRVDGDRAPRHDDLVRLVLEKGVVAVRQVDGTIRVLGSPELIDAPQPNTQLFLVPLRVRGATLGVLELECPEGLQLEGPQQRFLVALAYYAALAVDRARLEAEAGHADALREADRMKNALLASVSHDLRTPLTTIKALAHDLAAGDDRARIIEDEADRLNRLVADLLDLSQLQGGAIPLHTALNPVDDLIGATVQRLSGILGQREFDVSIQDDSVLLIGQFDFVHALRILVNLIENAHKYSPAGTPIALHVARDKGWLRFTVADRGPGVAEAERERIFEPFYRPSGAIADAGSIGLGLSIARRLAELQGGAVIYTPRIGGGSEFILTLPAADLPSDAIDVGILAAT